MAGYARFVHMHPSVPKTGPYAWGLIDYYTITNYTTTSSQINTPSPFTCKALDILLHH